MSTLDKLVFLGDLIEPGRIFPDVERLLEGVAFLNGLTRQKLDDEFPELLQELGLVGAHVRGRHPAKLAIFDHVDDAHERQPSVEEGGDRFLVRRVAVEQVCREASGNRR